MSIILSKYKTLFTVGFLVLFLFVGGIIISIVNTSNQPTEIRDIHSTSNIEERSIAYRALIERVGIEEAQELLVRSGLPFNGESHLLNHTTGNWLYENLGPEGLAQCKDYFLGSCYHGVILNTISEHGLDGVEALMESCYTKGDATAAACAHGIGHGLLSWTGYALLPQAATHCERFGDRDARFPTFNCYDGVFMENVWGVHSGEPSPDRWVKDTDPLFPCNDPRIKDEWSAGCYSNQASILFPLFEGDVTKAGEVCERIEDEKHRAICFDGIARQIHPIIQEDPRGVFALCGELTTPWNTQCVLSIVSADFSTGGRKLPYELCERIGDTYQQSCYTVLFDAISFTLEDTEDEERSCFLIENTVQQNNCLERIQH